ncbi:hypothetical protein WA538_000986 [Blastocystis sp. DL]
MSVVESILMGSTDRDVSEFLSALREYITHLASVKSSAEEVKEEETHSPSHPSLRDIVNQERLEAQKEQKERKPINVAEMKQREKLLNTYGFDVLETDENGNLIYREKAVEAEKDPLEGVNENALRVKMAEKMKREAMKAAHDSEVKRNKELEAKRKADKEKKKSVKQERKGRGGYM